MNAMPAHGGEKSGSDAPFYCLREKNSQRFWNGAEWADAPNAKSFSSLDAAFSIARRMHGSLDLLVLFPMTSGRLVIPLGQMN